MSDEKDRLGKVFKIGSIIFYIIIAIATIWNLRLTVRQTDLIFKPVVGIVDVKKTRHHPVGTEDTYENIIGASFRFAIQNVGSLPAKNFQIKVIGKLGETTLANRQVFDESHEGVVLVQGAKTFNTPTISKNTIETLVQKKERLFYTLDFSYSDWEEYEHYSYSTIFEVSVNLRTKPLDFAFTLVPYVPK